MPPEECDHLILCSLTRGQGKHQIETLFLRGVELGAIDAQKHERRDKKRVTKIVHKPVIRANIAASKPSRIGFWVQSRRGHAMANCTLVCENDIWKLTVPEGETVAVNGTDFTGERLLFIGDRLQVGNAHFSIRGDETSMEYFEEEAERTYDESEEPMHPLRLRFLFIDWAKQLMNLYDAESIRESLITLLFKITPAFRAEVYIDHAAPDPAIVAEVDRERGAVLIQGDGLTKLCVPIEGRGHRIGYVYAEAPEETPFEPMHLRMLTGINGVAALAFSYASYIRQLVEEKTELESRLGLGHELIGESPLIRKMTETIQRVAPTNATVLILGESGTGKELVARAIHHGSGRKGLFHAVNCAAIDVNLQKSQLFGHEKGAFTGADRQRKGEFELASGGTLFLDEVGELPLETQTALLRVLEEKKIRRVGGITDISVDVRVVAATNRDLEAMVQNGTFREDLYYRINVISISTPPLRDRPEDILRLATHFMHHFFRTICPPGCKRSNATTVLR
jgi:hypothetical protein